MTKKNFISMLGWIGVSMILAAYALLSFHLIEKSVIYHLLNLFGALLVVVDALDDKAYPPAALNIIWFIVALVALLS